MALSWARGRELTPQRLWPVLRSRGGVEGLLSSNEVDLSRFLGSSDRARAVLRAPEDRRGAALGAEIERTGIRVVTAFDDGVSARFCARSRTRRFSSSRSGAIERLRLPAVAVVGSREASRYGRDVAWRLAPGAVARRG